MTIAPKERSCLCNNQKALDKMISMVRINYWGSATMGGAKVKWQCPTCKTTEIIVYSDQVENVGYRCGRLVDNNHFPQKDIELIGGKEC